MTASKIRSWRGAFLAASIALLHLGAFPRGLIAGELEGTTPNDFFRRGVPTFVVGTLGDDRSDREIRSQAELTRNLLFPKARIVTDDSVAVERGPAAWPPLPILYGGTQANGVLAKLSRSLPFQLERGKLVLGGRTFDGEEHRLIALVPARKADETGPGYPEFLLYAGTGSPGVAEINAVRHGAEPILVADTFGRLLTGGWRTVGDDRITADFPLAPSRRIAWRSVECELQAAPGPAKIAVRFAFPQTLPAASDEGRLIDACLRGLSRSYRKLALAGPARLSVYVYPDRGSKAALTGDRGDGHAVPATHALHVLRSDPSEGGPLENLVAHEGTHVLAYDAWGLAATPLLGEGVAVWVSGQYGGTSLDEWKRRVPRPAPPVVDLLGGRFRQMPEAQSYPLAGLFAEAAIGRVGLAALRDQFYGANATTWADACRQAGTTPQALDAAFQANLTNPGQPASKPGRRQGD